jgi:hypothetical protein
VFGGGHVDAEQVGQHRRRHLGGVGSQNPDPLSDLLVCQRKAPRGRQTGWP